MSCLASCSVLKVVSAIGTVCAFSSRRRARRREEKAQTVPIALTTFNTEQLAKQDIRDTLSLTNVVPGLNFATGASLSPQYTFLRGAAGVVQYFDDVPTNILG